ncbi:MAG: hypothetical protein OEZ01_08260 [Candidatus Heimdallarchaeota archaeon]|nr:hypothetical protein [Candidatus Heimdallarchaeota archaeon]
MLLNLGIIQRILSHRSQAKSKLTWLMLVAILSISFWIILTYLQFEVLSIDNNLIGHAYLDFFSNIVILIGLFCLVAFFNLLVSPRLDVKIISVIGGLSFIILGLKLSHIVLAKNNELDLVHQIKSLTDVFNLIIIIFVIYFGHTDLKLLLKEDLNAIQRKQVKSLYNALLIGLSGMIPIIGLTLIKFEFLSFAYIFITIALFMVINTYVTDPRVAFILPEKTSLVLVVSVHGVYKYSKRFSESEEEDDDTILISGALNAIMTLMSEFYKSPSTPELIKFQNQLILLLWEKDYFIAAFSERDSLFIRNAMEKTVSLINNTYQENIKEIMFQSKVLDLDPIIKDSFYFVYH